MVSLPAVTFLLASLPGAVAQDPAADPFRTLRAVITEFGAADGARGVVMAIRDGQAPLILRVGSADGNADPVDQSLLPLGSLVRLLVADALYAERRGDLSAEVLRLGDTRLQVGDLLRGTTLVPDYYDLGGDSGGDAVGVAELQACAAMAAAAGLSFDVSGSGLGELELLQATAFGDRYRDWPTFLRGALAVHVPGLDPVDCANLPESERAAIPFLRSDHHDLAKARPAPRRLLVSAKNLAAWWQWRAQQEAPLWEGPRAGSLGTVVGRKQHPCWRTSSYDPGCHVEATQYPDRRAGMVVLMTRLQDTDPLFRALEEDLYGPADLDDEGVWNSAVGLGGGRIPRTPLRALADTAWRSTAGTGAEVSMRVTGSGADALELRLGERAWQSKHADAMGSGLRVVVGSDASSDPTWLYVGRRETAEGSARLTVVLMEQRRGIASIPRRFELTRQ